MTSSSFALPMVNLWLIIGIVAVLANVGLAFIPATIAKNKGYSLGAFWCISFFTTFIIGLIIALCIEDKKQLTNKAYGQQSPLPYPPYQPPYQPTYQFDRFCSKCGNGLKNGDAFCPKCGAKVD